MSERNPVRDRDRIPTGVEGLDVALGGGIPAGDLVALVAPPTSGAERLLYAFGIDNPTRYCSTLRPPAEVRDAMAAAGIPDERVDVRSTDGDDLLGTPADHLSGLDAGSVVVVDPATALERAGEERYRSFLEDLKRHCRTTESVAVSTTRFSASQITSIGTRMNSMWTNWRCGPSLNGRSPLPPTSRPSANSSGRLDRNISPFACESTESATSTSVARTVRVGPSSPPITSSPS